MPPAVIVAVSTPAGPASRGVVRLSGAGCFELVATLLAAGAREAGRGARGVRPAEIRLPVAGDPVACRLWCFPGPRSFTGEDLLEIHLLGAPLLLEAVVAACIGAGARPAGPGEFTRRAFENGRIDLTRAEAVAALIAASGRDERRQALALMDGGLERRVALLRDHLVDLLVPIELALDFSDQDEAARVPADAAGRLQVVREELERLAAGAATAARRAAFRVVLKGPPNAGKSSLFNRLVGRSEALVHPTPGTTRDAIMAPVSLGRARLELVDTAGAGHGRGAADAAAHRLRRRHLREADLVLEVRDGRQGVRPAAHGHRRMRVYTHLDRLPPGATSPPGSALVSNLSGDGIESLRRMLRLRLDQPAGLEELEPPALNARHGSAFSEASSAVGAALQALRGSRGLEFVAADVSRALRILRGITGEETDQRVLDRIFASFCIGK